MDLKVNAREELKLISVPVDSNKYESTSAYDKVKEVLAKVNAKEIMSGFKAEFAVKLEDKGIDANMQKTLLREENANRKMHLLVPILVANGVATPYAAFHNPCESDEAWAKAVPLNPAVDKWYGPRQAKLDWWVDSWMRSKDKSYTESVKAMELYFQELSSVTADLKELGIPEDAVLAIKQTLKGRDAIRREQSLKYASKAFKDLSQSDKKAVVEAYEKQYQALPTIVKLLTYGTELLSKEERQAFDGRMRAASRFKIGDAQAIAKELQVAILAKRKAFIGQWVKSWIDKSIVTIAMPDDFR